MRQIKFAAFTSLVLLNAGTVIEAQPSVPPNTILYTAGAQRDTRWHWIEVEASPDGWRITRGTATVQLDGARFSAELELNPDEPSGANINLQGSVDHGVVHATEILLNTDANPAAVSGSILSQPQGDMLAQRITFRGGQSGETSYLSLYRLTQAR